MKSCSSDVWTFLILNYSIRYIISQNRLISFNTYAPDEGVLHDSEMLRYQYEEFWFRNSWIARIFNCSRLYGVAMPLYSTALNTSGWPLSKRLLGAYRIAHILCLLFLSPFVGCWWHMCLLQQFINVTACSKQGSHDPFSEMTTFKYTNFNSSRLNTIHPVIKSKRMVISASHGLKVNSSSNEPLSSCLLAIASHRHSLNTIFDLSILFMRIQCCLIMRKWVKDEESSWVNTPYVAIAQYIAGKTIPKNEPKDQLYTVQNNGFHVN